MTESLPAPCKWNSSDPLTCIPFGALKNIKLRIDLPLAIGLLRGSLPTGLTGPGRGPGLATITILLNGNGPGIGGRGALLLTIMGGILLLPGCGILGRDLNVCYRPWIHLVNLLPCPCWNLPNLRRPCPSHRPNLLASIRSVPLKLKLRANDLRTSFTRK